MTENNAAKSHTVEKIGGTSMSRTAELFETLLVGNRTQAELYNRIFVVSAYGGITDALLEHKKSGEPGVYALFASSQGGWAWGDALTAVADRMQEINETTFNDEGTRQIANRFVRERIEGVRSCLIDLSRLCSFGHFQLEHHLLSVREMLSSLGEAQSAFNTTLLLNQRGVRARMIDLTGWREERRDTLDRVIEAALADIDLSSELPIVTGYAQCSEMLMGTYDRGYSEVTLSRIAVVTAAKEAIIHKEFHLSSADPKIVGTDAVRIIGETNYDVADQLSNMGMEAIHPRAAKSLRQAGIPLRVRNAFDPHHEGTVIRSDIPADTPQVEIITGLENVFAFEFYDQDMVGVKGYDAKILEALNRHKVWIISKTSNANTITHFLKGSMTSIKRVETDLSQDFPTAHITLRKVALVSAIGRNIGDTKVLANAIEALSSRGIRLLGVHDLLRKVDLQVIVDPADFEASIAALHSGLIEKAALDKRPSLHAAA
ncbi:aspartate kinase [Agrobacterium sp.]|uniref:aspartate kinase n=1 Tax=Agrobacterium sp. TaxID=361 RepID=UPI0028A650E2|nr:aspartate kinase [Agrobacterium sp.]